jgi:hypothetical protein
MAKINISFKGKNYSIDKSLLSGAVADLHVVLGGLHSDDEGVEYPAGLYQTGAIALYNEQGADAIEGMLVMSWDELVDYGYMTVTDGELYHTPTSAASPIITYAALAGCALEGDLILPKDGGITSIADFAFDSCSGLTGIVIPDSVVSIGCSAFSYCENLVYINVPDVVVNIGDSAFNECGSLSSITIPVGITNIQDYTFSGCKNLKSITIPNSVTIIGEYVFAECLNLDALKFEGSVSSWEAIDKRDCWNQNVPATYVQCSDGQVKLQITK